MYMVTRLVCTQARHEIGSSLKFIKWYYYLQLFHFALILLNSAVTD